MSDPLLDRWSSDSGLQPDLGAHLLRCWSATGRCYHDTRHLSAGLDVLDALGAGRLVRLGWWFHDAVHSGRTPEDERASAALARELLDRRLPEDEVDEVARLVLLTIGHEPAADDTPGALLCDADLAGLAAPWDDYCRQVDDLRAERPLLDDEAWRCARLARVASLLGRARLFHGPRAVTWEAGARDNLRREQLLLLAQAGERAWS